MDGQASDLRGLMVAKAREALTRAYAPYSGFRVAATVRAASGRLYVGVNVENASYGLAVCAERVAVFNAVASGEREIDEVVIVTETDEPTPPCGACRQVLAEFMKPDSKVRSVAIKSGREASWRLSELLPDAFRLGGVSKE